MLANERHPWDVRGKVGSEGKFASSDTCAEFRLDRDPLFCIGIPPAGTPQILCFVSGSWSQKTLYRQAGFGVENGTWVLSADSNCDLVWFPDSYSGQTGSRTPRDRDFTEKYTFGVHLRLLIITNHCPFLGAKSRHVPSRLLYAILILCGLRIPFFCASRKSVKIT